MKTLLPILCSILVSTAMFAQTTHVVTTSGVTFTPNTLTIELGDTIAFTSSGHSMTEVSQTTWNSNGNTSNGGFNTGVLSGQTSKFAVTGALGTRYFVCMPHAGSGMKGTLEVNSATAVTEESATVISFYPNPTSNVINVSGDVAYQIEVYSLNGKLITSSNALVNQIDISSIANGSYLVRLADKKGKLILSEKVTKK